MILFCTAQLILSQQSFPDEQFRVNEPWIARSRGRRHIGGVAFSGGNKGQDLPPALAGGVQKIDKSPGSVAHGANAIGGGQAGHMKQNTAGTRKHEALSLSDSLFSIIKAGDGAVK